MGKWKNKFFKKRRLLEDKEIALERIEILRKLIREDPTSKYNKRYSELIEKISKKHKVFKRKKRGRKRLKRV